MAVFVKWRRPPWHKLWWRGPLLEVVVRISPYGGDGPPPASGERLVVARWEKGLLVGVEGLVGKVMPGVVVILFRPLLVMQVLGGVGLPRVGVVHGIFRVQQRLVLMIHDHHATEGAVPPQPRLLSVKLLRRDGCVAGWGRHIVKNGWGRRELWNRREGAGKKAGGCCGHLLGGKPLKVLSWLRLEWENPRRLVFSNTVSHCSMVTPRLLGAPLFIVIPVPVSVICPRKPPHILRVSNTPWGSGLRRNLLVGRSGKRGPGVRLVHLPVLGRTWLGACLLLGFGGGWKEAIKGQWRFPSSFANRQHISAGSERGHCRFVQDLILSRGPSPFVPHRGPSLRVRAETAPPLS